MAVVDVGVSTCTQRVPSRLCGGLRGDDRPLCERTGPHKRHKTHRYLRGVGKTSWEWKAEKDPIEATPPPQTIFLAPAVKVKTWAPREATISPKCKCDGLRHKCKRYRGLYR